MSGFAGFVRADGETIRRDVVDAMVSALVGRGPDATGAWTDDTAALAHALFRTTDESAHERQPVLLDDRFVLVLRQSDASFDREKALKLFARYNAINVIEGDQFV